MMFVKNLLVAAFGLTMFMSSCSNEDLQDVNEYTSDTLFKIDAETRCGMKGCYELIFPLTINFADGTSAEVEDREALKAAIVAYKENGGTGRPSIAFPYEIMTEDGSVITVETLEQQIELRKACRAEMGNGPGHHSGKPCFRLQFPVSISFPDGTIVEYADRRALKMALREWKKDNQGATDRPVLVYPITVVFEDGTTAEVNSKEELKALKDDCK